MHKSLVQPHSVPLAAALCAFLLVCLAQPTLASCGEELRAAVAAEAVDADFAAESPYLVARYLRVDRPDSRNQILMLAEVQVFAPNGTNVALHKPIRTTNTHGNMYKGKAVDNDTETVASTRTGQHVFWEVDLGSAVRVQRVNLQLSSLQGPPGRIRRAALHARPRAGLVASLAG